MHGARAIPPTLKMRQRNNAEEKILHKRLLDIEADYRIQNGKIITEIAELNNMLTVFNLDGGDHCLDYFNTPSPENPKHTRNNFSKGMTIPSRLFINNSLDTKVEGRTLSDSSPDNDSTFAPFINLNQDTSPRSKGKLPSKNINPPRECVYGSGIKNIRCEHFPCVTPRSYHDIGFQIITRPYPEKQECSDKPQAETEGGSSIQDRGDVKATLDSQSSSPRARDSVNKQGKLSIREKVRTLKHVLDERKRKLAETKPKAWETNYGNPVPLRRIMNPLRPAATEGEYL